MHPKFLNLLRCPETGESLDLSAQVTLDNGMVWAGELRAQSSGRTYPILRGVPRFVSKEQYAASFGWEWSKWPRVQFESENVGRPMAGHTTRMWERITGASLDDVHGRTIVDFGCGPGRFLDVVRNKGGVAVGIDMSSAVDAARNNFADDPDVLIVQGDLLRPPFKEGVFDGGFTIGVLHHTPEPGEGLRALARTVRAGGWVSCCVYPEGGFYDYRSVRRFRRLHRRLSRHFEYLPALAYTYFAAYLLAPSFQFLKQHGLRRLIDHVERNWLVALWLKDAQWRVLDTFDAITPQIATTHCEEEVREWMALAGCEEVHRTAWCETSATAVRAVESVISQDVQAQSPVPDREGLVPWFQEEEESLTLSLSGDFRSEDNKVAA
ncbi:MAG TPA: class I SAM-dependent methyltransferase [Tepidisphaeraceae bacterium]|nr:class I SAM-dependent methyltransferase [Tepidisphaeraceae bacterium]